MAAPTVSKVYFVPYGEGASDQPFKVNQQVSIYVEFDKDMQESGAKITIEGVGEKDLIQLTPKLFIYYYVTKNKTGTTKITKISGAKDLAGNAMADHNTEYNIKVTGPVPLEQIRTSYNKNFNIGPTADNSSRISRIKRIHKRTSYFNQEKNLGMRARLWGHNELPNKTGSSGDSSQRIYFQSMFPRMSFR